MQRVFLMKKIRQNTVRNTSPSTCIRRLIWEDDLLKPFAAKCKICLDMSALGGSYDV